MTDAVVSGLESGAYPGLRTLNLSGTGAHVAPLKVHGALVEQARRAADRGGGGDMGQAVGRQWGSRCTHRGSKVVNENVMTKMNLETLVMQVEGSQRCFMNSNGHFGPSPERHPGCLHAGLRDEGSARLAAAMRSGACGGLTTLNISDNHIRAAGAQSLSAALGSGGCARLNTLAFEDNKIGDEGAEHLAVALESGACCSLRRLHLGSSGRTITESGLGRLLEAVESKGCGLTYLDAGAFHDPTSKAAVQVLRGGRGGAVLFDYFAFNPRHRCLVFRATTVAAATWLLVLQ